MPGLVESLLMGLVAPIWLFSGWLDCACHRRLGIEHTSGTRESVLHLVMLAELGVGIAAALLLEPNAGSFAVMLAACAVHEATVWVDLAYASTRRQIPWFEQSVHGIQQALPWVALVGLMVLHSQASLSLFGLGAASADWRLLARDPPLSPLWMGAFAVAAALVVGLPYLAEYRRCRRAA